MRKETIIFLHITKTAGSTITNILSRLYNPVNSLFGTPSLPDLGEYVKNLSDIQRKKLELIAGHLEFGVHKLLPQSATYFTFLRNPIDRVISDYYYVLRTKKHPLYEKVVGENISLKDFVELKFVLDNSQTRMIAGLWRTPQIPCTEESVITAKNNIKNHFSVLGLTEHFDDSLILLQKKFGWKDITYLRKFNQTRNRPRIQDLSEDALQTIVEANEFDIQLYEFGQVLFDQQVDKYISEFDRKVFSYHQTKRRFTNRVGQYSVREKIRQVF